MPSAMRSACSSDVDVYMGVHRSMPFLNFTLICDKSATEANPRLISYQAHPSRLHLEWASPDACPRSGSIFDGIGGGNSNSGGGGSSTGGGVGFGGLLGTLFWIFMIGLFLYFAVGQSCSLKTAPPIAMCTHGSLQASFINVNNTRPEDGISCHTEISGESSLSCCKICSHICLQV